MPLATASLHPPKRFAPAPAPLTHTRPVTLSSPHPANLSLRYKTRVPTHAAAPLAPFVLVKQEQHLGHARAGFSMRCRGSQKALPTSVLVKRVLGPSIFLAGAFSSRVTQSCVSWTHAIGQRVGPQCGTRRDTEKRIPGCREAVAGMPCKARQFVLVKSFSSPCPAPLLQRCLPGVGLTLNGWGVCRA
jgi:hypothetical protein